jgi:metal-responsive CopG/Arc/MetJ family transcriptional regulator
MRPIQILMDDAELKLIDREAKRQGTDRSKLMREAVRRYLVRLTREAAEQQYVESYRRKPEQLRELRDWEKVQAWPED